MISIRGSVGRRGQNMPADVRTVQELLNANIGRLVPYAPLLVDGRSGPKTVGLIEEYQRRALQMPRPDGRVDPGGRTITSLVKSSKAPGASSSVVPGHVMTKGRANLVGGSTFLDGVDPKLRDKVVRFAATYGPIKLASGKRTLRKQAELMAPMSDSDLDMYGSQSSYVKAIKKLEKSERTVDAVEKILAEARARGSRISYHLVGHAMDISAKDGFDWKRAKALAEQYGLKVKLEKSRNCFHVQL